MHSYLTLILVVWPLLGGGLVFFFKNSFHKTLTLIVALLELIIGLYMVSLFEPTQGLQFVFDIPWVQTAGIRVHLAIDGISILPVLLTVILTPFIVLAAWGRNYEKSHLFYGLILLMQSALVGVFTAQDAFLYYLFWEAALIPIYFLAAVWGGDDRIRVTFKFFIYTMFGSLFMLISLVYMYMQTPGMHSASLIAFRDLGFDETTQGVLFWGLFLAFAIKMPLFPFHTWQPGTYSEAPAPATMLLSGIMLKMGIYSLYRWLLPIVPEAVQTFAPYITVLCVIGIIYGAVIAITQKDMKRLLAYSSFSHVGLMAAGVFSLTVPGLQGALIQMLAHGINIMGLFFIVDIIQRKTQTRNLEDLGGINQVTPALTVYFAILMLGSVALPFTNGFVGEFMLLYGVFNTHQGMGIIAGVTIILGAVYMLRLFQRSMLGERTVFTTEIKDISWQEGLALFPLVVLVFWMGIYPQTFLKLTEPAVIQLIHQLGLK